MTAYHFLAEARTDLDEAADWYECRQPGPGDRFVAEVSAAIQRVLSFPQAAPTVSNCPPGRDVRVVIPHRFDYLAVYEVMPARS